MNSIQKLGGIIFFHLLALPRQNVALSYINTQYLEFVLKVKINVLAQGSHSLICYAKKNVIWLVNLLFIM